MPERPSKEGKDLAGTEAAKQRKSIEIEILYQRCAGLDVHKKTVKVCLLIRQEDGQLRKEFRTDGTTTQDLLEMADWLKKQKCTHVAMEGTGVYWKPVYNLLADSFTLLVVNAQHMKAVPGRKTDIKDAGANRSA
jgi:transposase